MRIVFVKNNNVKTSYICHIITDRLFDIAQHLLTASLKGVETHTFSLFYILYQMYVSSFFVPRQWWPLKRVDRSLVGVQFLYKWLCLSVWLSWGTNLFQSICIHRTIHISSLLINRVKYWYLWLTGLFAKRNNFIRGDFISFFLQIINWFFQQIP